MARFRLLLLLSLAGALVGACSGSSDGSGTDLERLRGQSVGIAALEGVPVLELRYVLLQDLGLEAGPSPDADVALVESSADSLLAQLRAGELDAALVSGRAAYDALADDDIQVLSPVAERVGALAGVPVAASVLVTYPDVADERPAALTELLSLFEASVTYFEANEEDVIAALTDDAGKRAYVAWWFDHFAYAPGPVSADVRTGLARFWEASRELGDIEELPDLEALLFDASAPKPAATPTVQGVRQTLSLAVHDDLARRAVLYALETGLVTSETLDVTVTYLPTSGLMDAASSREHDVVEATPLTIAQAGEAGLELVIVSDGLFDVSGTYLVSY